MSFKFKFAKKRKNPTKPQEGDQWHAIPVTTNRLTTRSLCKVVTRNTTTAPTEAESTFNLVCDGIVHELQQGSSVQLGELGWLRLSFGSEGVEDLTQFDAASMIRNVKIIFTPSKTLMADIKNGLEFENVGVVDEGFNRVKRTLIGMIRDNPADGEYAIDLLMIAKYFERIGDHAVNIAEWVEFAVTGVHGGE